MATVDALCSDSANYPLNLIGSSGGNKPEYSLQSYHARLRTHQDRLFTADGGTKLDFWEYARHGTSFWHRHIKSYDGLRSYLGLYPLDTKADPKCRFLFVQGSGHSRAKLRTSKEALTLAFTYLQIMPEFLDLVFLFGEQISAQNLYHTGFYECARLSDFDKGLRDSARSWSGMELQLCYSLKSVEPSPFQEDWPWSIRHCAVHHTFDVLNIRSTWVVIKGDDEINKRIQSVIGHNGPAGSSSFDSIDKAFTAALALHLIMCEWSSEHWPLYICFLEEKFGTLTDEVTTVNANVSSNPIRDVQLFMAPTSSETQTSTPQTRKSRVFSWNLRTQSRDTENIPLSPTIGKTPPRTFTNSSGKKQPMPPGKRLPVCKKPHEPTVPQDEYGQQQFSFRDVQKANEIEESVNECVLVLRLNISIVTQLKDYYGSLMGSDELPLEIRQRCRFAWLRFERRINGIVSNFELQILRAEALLRLIAGRKNLLYGYSEFQSTLANRQLALHTRNSTNKMEALTYEMSYIARETKTETVSMKIITLVTLFFLPGTFISTVMSTDIVRWNRGERKFEWQALKTYLCVTLPFMAAVFFFWLGLHLLERKKEKEKLRQMREMRQNLEG